MASLGRKKGQQKIVKDSKQHLFFRMIFDLVARSGAQHWRFKPGHAADGLPSPDL